MTFTRRAFSFLALLALAAGLAGEAHASDAPDTTAAPVARGGTDKERLVFAVVIGNNKSLGRRRPELHYADDDAARYFEILQTMAPGRVSLLTDFDRDTERLFPDTKPRAMSPSRKHLDALGRRLAAQVSDHSNASRGGSRLGQVEPLRAVGDG